MLLPRLITAILGIPIVILCVYYGGGLYFVFILIILLYMTKEFCYMVNKAGYDVSVLFCFLVSIFIFLAIIFEPLQFNKFSLYISSIIITFLIFLSFLIEILKQKPLGAVGRISVSFFIPMIFAWSLAHLYLIRDIKNYGQSLTYTLFFSIWISDNMSYIFGTLFGKKKLASVISPKKTIVGLLAGVAFGCLGFLFFSRIFLIDNILEFKKILFLGILIPVVACLSDLGESLIKRDCGFKDSDNLLVGHGGMLDRFDSFIFTSPIYYYFLVVFLKK